MKKAFVLFLLMAFVATSVIAQDFEVEGAVPYDKNATPRWAKDLRRAEIITLGSWPITMLITSFGFSIAKMAENNWNSNYLINPFVNSSGIFDTGQTMAIIFTSLGVSAGIGLTDFIVNLVRRKKIEKQRSTFSNENVTITPLQSPNERMMFLQQTESAHLFGNLESAVF